MGSFLYFLDKFLPVLFKLILPIDDFCWTITFSVLFIVHHRDCNYINSRGVTSGTGIAYHSGAPGFCGVRVCPFGHWVVCSSKNNGFWLSQVPSNFSSIQMRGVIHAPEGLWIHYDYTCDVKTTVGFIDNCLYYLIIINIFGQYHYALSWCKVTQKACFHRYTY